MNLPSIFSGPRSRARPNRLLFRAWLVSAAALICALGASAVAARDVSSYVRVAASPDGIGFQYMGREIARVMGYEGADWLERDTRTAEERPDLLLRALELKPGMTVDLVVDGFADRKFTGRIGRINPSTEAGTRAILVFVGIPNATLALRGGMFATGRIALAAGAPVATLPATAVRTEAGQTYIWTIQGGKLAKRNILVGRRDDDAGRVELKTALPADLQVLAARFDNLKEGAPALVRAQDETPPKKAS